MDSMDCSCGKSMGLVSGPMASFVKCLNVLSTGRKWV
jgi:hypothetical protein